MGVGVGGKIVQPAAKILKRVLRAAKMVKIANLKTLLAGYYNN